MRDFRIEPDGFDYKGALEEAIDHIENLIGIAPSDDEYTMQAKEFLDDDAG